MQRKFSKRDEQAQARIIPNKVEQDAIPLDVIIARRIKLYRAPPNWDKLYREYGLT